VLPATEGGPPPNFSPGMGKEPSGKISLTTKRKKKKKEEKRNGLSQRAAAPHFVQHRG